MALTSYAQLTADGAALDGDTSVSTMGGIDVSSDHIECFSVRWGSHLKDTSASGRARNPVVKLPVTLVKPVDKTTPLLYQALATNQRVDGSVKIFQTDPQTGETLHRFTLQLDLARIVSLEGISPNTLGADTAVLPPTEQVQLLAQTLTYIDEVNGVEYEQA